MEGLEKWQDSDGFIHVNPNPTLNDSENGPLFTAYVADLGFRFSYPLVVPRLYHPTLTWRANRLSKSNHFSLDNMLGVYYLLGGGNDLPLSYWNNTWHLHPNTWLPFALVKGKIWSYILIWGLFIMAYISAKRPKQVTSGKLLWRLRFRLLERFAKNRYVRIIGGLGVKMMEHLVDYKEARTIYFKHPDHPIHWELE